MPTTRLPAVNRNRATNRALDPDRAWIRLLRIGIGGLAIAAVVWNMIRAANGLSPNTPMEVVSQFTNQANLGFGAVAIIGGFVPRDRLPHWWDHLRGAFAFYMVMTGLIYALLVAAPGELARWDLGWTNLALHRLTPVVGLVGWLVVTMTTRGGWGRPLAWLLFPIAFLVYTWVRGAIVDWYPYGFLDPTREGGWAAVAQTTSMVVVAFLTVALVMHVLGNLRVAAAHRGAGSTSPRRTR